MTARPRGRSRWPRRPAGSRGVPTAGLVLWEAPLQEPSELAAVRSWVADVTGRLDAGDLAGATAQHTRDMPVEFREGLARMPFHDRFVAQAAAYRADGESLVRATSGSPGELLGRRVLALVGEETFPGMAEAAARVVREVPGARSEVPAGAWHSWDAAAAVDRFADFARQVQPAAVRARTGR